MEFVIPSLLAPRGAETAIFPKEYQRFGGGQNHIKRLFSVIPAYFPPQNTFPPNSVEMEEILEITRTCGILPGRGLQIA